MTQYSTLSQLKLGILGGGQLGRMFIQEAISYDATIHILDADINAPACNIAHSHTIGNLNDYNAVYNFGKTVDILTIEIEHVNVQALEQLEREGLKIYPQPAALKIIQDKGKQKLFYKTNKLPTADFYLIDKKADLYIYQHLFPMVLKLRKGGYDGKGVMILRTSADITNAFDGQCVLEKLVDFEKETAVIVARNIAGDVATFPMVDMDFNADANLVEFIYSPSQYTALEENAKQIAIKIITDLNMVGILAVEYFVTKSGELIINEIAPRPHNSGHHSIEACYTSQYEQHMRAIFNLPLGNTQLIQPAVMVNVLGAPNYTGNTVVEGLHNLLKLDGAYLHLYGKKTCAPMRKMGHITVINNSIEIAKSIAKQASQLLIVRGESRY
jgi:5-(carboxyamino)imidazole ribonucleotide synthase